MLRPPLEQALLAIAKHPPPTLQASAQAWANAVGSYLGAVTPPSSTAAAAVPALVAQLAQAFGTRATEQAPTAPADAMDAALQTYAGVVAGGMAGFTGNPPLNPVGFASLFAGAKPQTHEAAAAKIATAIAAWAITGTATSIASGATTPWA